MSRDFLKQACNLAAVELTKADIFQCSECGKWFDLAHNLERPKQSHLSKDKVSCAKCDKTFLYELALEEQDYSPAAEEMRIKLYTINTHISSFQRFPSLKCVSKYSDCLVMDKIIYDELTALDYERTGYMMLTMAMEDTARIDWLDVHETDVHAKCSEDDADDNVEYLEDDDTEEVVVPDETRPAEPDVQQLQPHPLYALLAYLESAPGLCNERLFGGRGDCQGPRPFRAQEPRDVCT